MKKIIANLFILIGSQICFAQVEAYKIDEFVGLGGGCSGNSRYANFEIELAKNDENKGLVVIYTGENKERFGNISAYVKNVRKYVKFYTRISPEKVDVIVLEGKKFFAHEFWVIPRGAKLPYTESYEFEWSKIQGKYHFSNTCLQCEPSYPLITEFQANFEEFANILKQYPSYKGQIIVNDYWELTQVKQGFPIKIENKVVKSYFRVAKP
ncbi:MAG TPA: hypothetical protein PKY82_09660 [Pyrinomonadaceae bacterium]|nr:hypothetical protein [Pyrinomonadaceae bacterium]